MKRKKEVKPGGEFTLPGWARVVIIVMVLIVSGLYMARSIDLTTADLGRHIMNGQVFMETHDFIKTNYYSYTEPSRPVVNHHWGTGVIYYAVYKAAGFTGLSLLNIFLFIAAVFIFVVIALKKSDIATTLFITSLTIPLLANRAEIRPEIISSLLVGVTFFVLDRFRDGKLAFRKLWFLPLLMVVWVNLHIFFVMGLLIQGVFLADSLLRGNKEQLKKIGMLLAVSSVMCLLNPSGLYGFIEPFLILREYGYLIAENQSLFFMQARFPWMIYYLQFEIMAVAGLAVFTVRMIKSRRIILHDAPVMALMLLFILMGSAMIRMIPLFGFFFIPAMSGSLHEMAEKHLPPRKRMNLRRIFFGLGAGLVLFSLSTRDYYYSAVNEQTGIGWNKLEDGSAEFFKMNRIKGPVFNNYDIGGYLIFHFFPAERVFVDNRPEAYSVSFFKDIYEPVQASGQTWKAAEERYQFNVIFFNRLDYTQFAQPFLLNRIRDPEWAPVFVDNRTIILLKRNIQNEAIIRQYELPASMFGTSPGG